MERQIEKERVTNVRYIIHINTHTHIYILYKFLSEIEKESVRIIKRQIFDIYLSCETKELYEYVRKYDSDLIVRLYYFSLN